MISVHLEDGVVEVRERPLPNRPPGFALIRLLCGGICNTDLELQRGYYNFRGTPGHEFVGEVVEADGRALAGRRVVGEINLACGNCEWCARGLGRAFSEFFTLPERNLHVLPDDLPSERAVFTEPLAAACEILDQVDIPQGGEVAVLGGGKLGLLVAQVLEAHGAKAHIFGRHAEAASYEWVVEATGSAEGLSRAIDMTRPRGTLILKSTLHEPVAIDTARVVVNEITLIGSRCGRFEPALELLRRGAVRVEEMISARFPLAEAPQAFAVAARKGALKVLLS